MEKETEFMKSILPDHYTCEPRENGVHCFSSKGINDDHNANSGYDPQYDDHWGLIVKAIEEKFGDRLMEIYHQTCTNHLRFTVYIKPNNL